MALSGSFLIHALLTITACLKLYKVCNIYPRLIKSPLDNVKGNKFNKGSLEIHNDRFLGNYESPLPDSFFKITLTASISIF